MIIPESLKKGDRITIVSPAGKIDHFLVYKAKYTLEENGFEVINGEHALGSHGRYSGTREERLSDFINALEDEQTKAI